MADVQYTRALSAFTTSGGVVALDRFEQEIDNDPAITIALSDKKLSIDATNVYAYFKAILPVPDEAAFNALITAHSGEPLPDPGMPVSVSNSDLSVSVSNNPRIEFDLRSDSRVTMFSPNLCDKCTWYQESIEVVAETLTPDANYETYSSQHEHWIDLYHGRVSDEDDLVSGYPIIVKVNGVEKTMDAPFGAGGDGDYSLDPVTGRITFHVALTGTDTVTATYHYADKSTWTMKPTPGKNLELLAAECQLSKNVVMEDTIQYKVLILGQYIGGPPGVLVPIRTKKYKNSRDFINESNGAYPEVPSFGGTMRGISNPVLIFPWLYKTKTLLYSAYGMEIQVSLADDQECDGELAVVTFYCISSDA
jgi:hypothetical protein